MLKKLYLPGAISIFGLLSLSARGADAHGDPTWDPTIEERRHALWGVPEEMGEWYRVPLPDKKDRMQAIHSVLLPSGKVLMVSGSSFRLRILNGQPVEGIEATKAKNIDNTAIFDPERVPFDPVRLPPLDEARAAFTRIPSPPMLENGESNDLFCAGHLHTPDGNVLFASGTRQNRSILRFPGHKYAYLFNWKADYRNENPWKPAGKLRDGHWYPAMLPLPDGKIALMSGFQAEPPQVNSSWVEVYDYRKPPESAWKAVNIGSDTKGPFAATYEIPGATDADAPVLQKDHPHHYPRIFALRDGRFFITGDGSGGGEPARNTYFMKFDWPEGDLADPKVSFEPGPQRPTPRRVYSTALIDPNSKDDILLMGGVLNGGGSAMSGPYHNPNPSEFPDIVPKTRQNLPPEELQKLIPKTRRELVSSDLERFSLNKNFAGENAPDAAGGKDKYQWEITRNFLGERMEDRRIQHIAVILPTKEFLVLGGGNYFFNRPVFVPQLFKPSPTAPGGYTSLRMNPATQPRLYHNTALLLPDGRVFTAGGNAARAGMDDDGNGPVENIQYNFIKRHPITNYYGFVEDGEYAIPGENHQIELYSPPYLFIKGPRPKFVSAPETVEMPYGGKASLKIENTTPKGSLVLIKLGSATHAWDHGQRLFDLKFALQGDQIQFEAPDLTENAICTPGYYMLFYVNERGQPVERAAMVKILPNI